MNDYILSDMYIGASEDQSQKLSRYLGANLLMEFSAFLNVYGAEESSEFEFEEAFDGTLSDCLDHLVEYQKIIDRNGLDAYLSLEPWSGGRSFQGDLYYILTDLVNEGYITQEGFDYYYYDAYGNDSDVSIRCSTEPKYFANMVSCSTEDVDYKYYVAGYFDNLMRGLYDNLSTDSFDTVLNFAHEMASEGCFIEIKNMITGDAQYYDANVWMDNIEQGGVPEEVYELA